MSSRIIVQLLLSLLLLLSQQLAVSHVYTHVPAAQRLVALLQGDASNSDDSKRSIAADHLCGLCVSGDQLAHALGVPSYSFNAVAPEYLPLTAADTPAACLRTVCVFQSRAPPLA